MAIGPGPVAVSGVDRLDRLAQAVGDRSRRLPPVNDWTPARRGSIDIRIDVRGQWHHDGAPIRRAALVRLFSTILRRDPDDQYYLVTPVEQLRIQVDDVPFIAVALESVRTGGRQTLSFETNVGDRVIAGPDHPLWVDDDEQTGEPRPYLRVRDRLDARLERSVFYQLADLAETHRDGGMLEMRVTSDGAEFQLGRFPVED